MTYQTTSEHGSVRSTAMGALSILRTGAGVIGGWLVSIGDSYMKAAVASSRGQLIEKLHAKSDAELAALGIKREEIGRFVFRDLYYF